MFQGACCLGINAPAVTIKNIENSIIDFAWQKGWMVPCPPLERTGKKVAVIGSGPSGLATAAQLNKVGTSKIHNNVQFFMSPLHYPGYL